MLSAASRFHAKPATEVALRTTPRLAQKAKALAGELRRLEAKDIKKQLHVNDALAKQYETHLSNFEKTPPIPAVCLFDSPLFDGLDAASFDIDDAEWANQTIRIFSGIYGLIRPFDEIQPLSLPVSLGTKLSTTKGKFLRDYWRDPIRLDLEETLSGLPLPVLVTCGALDTDADILTPELLPEGCRVSKVDFKIRDKTQHGEALGEFLRWAMENRCSTLDEFLGYRGNVDEDEPAQYRISTKGAKGGDLLFEESVGGGDTWSAKLAESGLSKGKFVKEFASGKNRYKRTEMNKAMIKDIKKQRQKAANVY